MEKQRYYAVLMVILVAVLLWPFGTAQALYWDSMTNMPTARAGGVTGWYNGKLFVACGITNITSVVPTGVCEAFDPNLNSWTTMAPAPVPVCWVGTGKVQWGSKLYVVAGRGSTVGALSYNQAYDMSANSWQMLARCNAREQHGAASDGGFIYIFGGFNGSVMTDAQKYSITANQWTSIAPLPAARQLMAGVGLRGLIYCLGGLDAGGNPVTQSWAYNPANNLWSPIANLPVALFRPVAVADTLNNRIYLLGGMTSTTGGIVSTVYSYNPALNIWTTDVALPAARYWVCAGGDDAGRMYACGGVSPLPVEPTVTNQTWRGTIYWPLVNVTLTPINPPIVIPPGGGSFSYNCSGVNTGPAQVPFAVWARIKNPDGTWTAPTLGPVTVNPPLNSTVTRTRTQTVPGTWPAGTYLYAGYAASTYGGVILDSSYFSWSKSALDDGSWFTGASPNPFNPMTAISYQLSASRQVSLRVYDVSGRLVATLVDEIQTAGRHSTTFDGSNLPSGLYFYHLAIGQEVTTGKLVLAK